MSAEQVALIPQCAECLDVRLPDDELVAAIDKGSPVLAKALDEIRKLKPPADEQATVDGWLTPAENVEGDLKELRDKAKSNDTLGVESVLSRATLHNAKSRDLATELGMKVCNED